MKDDQPDLLCGYEAIGAHLGISGKSAERHIRKGLIKTFRRSSAIYARRSELSNWSGPLRGRPRCEDPDEIAAREARRIARREELADLERLRKEAERANVARAGLLYGMNAIASFLGISPRQAYHLREQGNLPTFKMGGKVCALRSELAAHFAKLSKEARHGERR